MEEEATKSAQAQTDDYPSKEDELSAVQVKDAFRFPIWRPLRRKLPPDSPFFASGNLERELFAKQVILDISEEEKAQISHLEESQRWEMKCPVVGCNAKLNGLKDLESHYFSRHTAMCSVCSRVFPTGRLLDLHVSEMHDSFFQAKAARGHPMYKCLVEGCDARFQNDISRHQHLVDKHKFPQAFQFHKKRHASQKQRHRTRVQQASNPKEEVHTSKDIDRRKDGSPSEETKEGDSEMQMEVEALTSAVSRLSTLEEQMPSQISFGRRHNRAFGFVPRSVRGRGNQKTAQGPKEQHQRGIN